MLPKQIATRFLFTSMIVRWHISLYKTLLYAHGHTLFLTTRSALEGLSFVSGSSQGVFLAIAAPSLLISNLKPNLLNPAEMYKILPMGYLLCFSVPA